MDTDSFASRLATRLRLPIAVVGTASLVLAVANLFFDAVDDGLIVVAATLVGIAAVAMFSCVVFDMRLQRAASALNTERRGEAREKGPFSRFTGWRLPVGDRLLVAVSLPLLALSLVAAIYLHRGPTTALLFAAFALVGLARMALMVRGQPTDRWFDPFA